MRKLEVPPKRSSHERGRPDADGEESDASIGLEEETKVRRLAADKPGALLMSVSSGFWFLILGRIVESAGIGVGIVVGITLGITSVISRVRLLVCVVFNAFSTFCMFRIILDCLYFLCPFCIRPQLFALFQYLDWCSHFVVFLVWAF